MKFRVVLEVIFNDGTADKVAIYTYDSEDKALQGFYGYMAQYVSKDNVASVNVIAKNSVGVIYKNETWTGVASAPTVAETVAETEEA